MDELLKIQQGTIKIIEKDLKEIKKIAKKAIKEVKLVRSEQIEQAVRTNSKEVLKQVNFTEKQLLILKFKTATPDSLTTIRKLAKMVNEQKVLLLESYSQL